MKKSQQVANQVINDMGLKPRIVATATISQEVMQFNRYNERFQNSVKKDLARQLGEMMLQEHLPLTREGVKNKYYSGMQNTEISSEVIVFNEDKFYELLDRFYMEVVENEKDARRN